jgi:hypothetical protein
VAPSARRVQVNPSSNTNCAVVRLVLPERPGRHRYGVRTSPQHARHVDAALSDWAWSVAAKWQFSASTSPASTKRWNYEVANGLVTNKLKRNSFWGVGHDDQRRRQRPVLLCTTARLRTARAARSTRRQPVITPNAVTGSNISRVAGLAKGDNTGASHWEVSYSYDLSRRTRIYTGYVKINNDSNASYNFNINAYPGNAGGRYGRSGRHEGRRLRDGHVPQLLIADRICGASGPPDRSTRRAPSGARFFPLFDDARHSAFEASTSTAISCAGGENT